MSAQILYNKDPLHDVINILSYINSYSKDSDIQNVVLDTAIIEKIVQNIRTNFPHNGGIEKASAFKQVAYFMCHFIQARPILEPFPIEVVRRLATVENHQNAMIAFAIAEEALHQSKIEIKTGRVIDIVNRINYSSHSYVDIVEALSSITCEHYQLVSVLLEQLVYKTNPTCQYSSSSNKSGWGA